MGNSFLIILALLFSARENVPNSFKSRLFPIKSLDKSSICEPATEPTIATKAKTKREISSLKMREEFRNQI